MGTSASDLAKLYLAYFGRPPDFDGLAHYAERLPPVLIAGLGSATIKLPQFPPDVDIDAPAQCAGGRGERIGPSPAMRVLERQRAKRLRLIAVASTPRG